MIWLIPHETLVIRDEYYRLPGPLNGELAYRVVYDTRVNRKVALRTNAVLGEN